MDPRLRQVLRLVAATSAALALLLAPILLSVHRAEVHHTRCLEHGELIELSDAAAGEHQDHHNPVAVPGHTDSHDQHCSIDGAVGPVTVATAGSQVLRSALPCDAPVLLSAAPRGPPPLSYAPKTSPPTCA